MLLYKDINQSLVSQLFIFFIHSGKTILQNTYNLKILQIFTPLPVVRNKCFLNTLAINDEKKREYEIKEGVNLPFTNINL